MGNGIITLDKKSKLKHHNAMVFVPTHEIKSKQKKSKQKKTENYFSTEAEDQS